MLDLILIIRDIEFRIKLNMCDLLLLVHLLIQYIL